MIRPSVAPFTTSCTPKEPEFCISFTPSSNPIIPLQTKTQTDDYKQPTSQPPKIISQYAKKHSKQKEFNRSWRSDYSGDLDDKVKLFCNEFLESYLARNEEKMASIKQEMNEIKVEVAGMVKKAKFQVEESLRKIMTNIVNGIKIQGQEEMTILKKQCYGIADLFHKFQKENRENVQRAYEKMKDLAQVICVVNARLQMIQKVQPFQEKWSGHKQPPQNKHTPLTKQSSPVDQFPPQIKMVSSIRQIVGSSKVSQPESILSGYESSINKALQSNIKQQIPSIIRNLSIQQGDSEMVMVDEKGVMYDIDGIPIVDTHGNMMILKLKQIKHLLENEINV